MLDYVFFDTLPCEKFIEYLTQKGITYEAPDGEEILMVSIDEELGDDITSDVEAFYDEMMELGSQILSNQTGDGQVNTAGLTVTLADGRVSYAVLEPSIVNKVLSVLELDELNTLVNAIVNAVENPDETPLCKREY